MRKKKVKPYRSFSKCVQARFDTVGNKYLFKGEAKNLFVNLSNVSVINPVFDQIGACICSGITKLPLNSVESCDKDISNVGCVVKKSAGHKFHYNVFAKTFFPKCEYISPIIGRPVTTNQYNIGLLIGKDLGDDIGEPSSCSVDHSFSSTHMCWVDGDEPPACTDDLKSILVNTVSH